MPFSFHFVLTDRAIVECRGFQKIVDTIGEEERHSAHTSVDVWNSRTCGIMISGNGNLTPLENHKRAITSRQRLFVEQTTSELLETFERISFFFFFFLIYNQRSIYLLIISDD